MGEGCQSALSGCLGGGQQEAEIRGGQVIENICKMLVEKAEENELSVYQAESRWEEWQVTLDLWLVPQKDRDRFLSR